MHIFHTLINIVFIVGRNDNDHNNDNDDNDDNDNRTNNHNDDYNRTNNHNDDNNHNDHNNDHDDIFFDSECVICGKWCLFVNFVVSVSLPDHITAKL